jgi:hypothetical protein
MACPTISALRNDLGCQPDNNAPRSFRVVGRIVYVIQNDIAKIYGIALEINRDRIKVQILSNNKYLNGQTTHIQNVTFS